MFQHLGPILKQVDRHEIGTVGLGQCLLQHLDPAAVGHITPLQIVGKPGRGLLPFPIDRPPLGRLKDIAVQQGQAEHILAAVAGRHQGRKACPAAIATDKNFLHPARVTDKIRGRGSVLNKDLGGPALHEVGVKYLLTGDKMRPVVEGPGLDPALGQIQPQVVAFIGHHNLAVVVRTGQKEKHRPVGRRVRGPNAVDGDMIVLAVRGAGAHPHALAQPWVAANRPLSNALTPARGRT